MHHPRLDSHKAAPGLLAVNTGPAVASSAHICSRLCACLVASSGFETPSKQRAAVPARDCQRSRAVGES